MTPAASSQLPAASYRLLALGFLRAPESPSPESSSPESYSPECPSLEPRVPTLFAIVAACLMLGTACRDLQVVTNTYATLAEARTAGAIDKGWIPPILPDGAHDIREAHDEAHSRRRWGLFSFGPNDDEPFRRSLGSEMSLHGVAADPPPRIEWWPVLLRGSLDAAKVVNTGLKGYGVSGDELVVAVNWNQRRAYYWSRR